MNFESIFLIIIFIVQILPLYILYLLGCFLILTLFISGLKYSFHNFILYKHRLYYLPVYSYIELFINTLCQQLKKSKQIISTILTLNIFWYFYIGFFSCYPLPEFNINFIIFALISALIININNSYFNDEIKFFSIQNFLIFLFTFTLFILGRIVIINAIPVILNITFIDTLLKLDTISLEDNHKDLEAVRNIILDPETVKGRAVICYSKTYSEMDPALLKDTPITPIVLTPRIVVEGIKHHYFTYHDLAKYTAATIMQEQGFFTKYKIAELAFNTLDQAGDKNAPIKSLDKYSLTKVNFAWQVIGEENLKSVTLSGQFSDRKITIGQAQELFRGAAAKEKAALDSLAHIGGKNERFLEDTIPLAQTPRFARDELIEPMRRAYSNVISDNRKMGFPSSFLQEDVDLVTKRRPS